MSTSIKNHKLRVLQGRRAKSASGKRPICSKSGYLLKGPSRVRRWFVLCDDVLSYFSNETSMKIIDSLFLVDLVKARLMEDGEFSISTAKEELLLKADSVSEAKSWIRALERNSNKVLLVQEENKISNRKQQQQQLLVPDNIYSSTVNDDDKLSVHSAPNYFSQHQSYIIKEPLNKRIENDEKILQLQKELAQYKLKISELECKNEALEKQLEEKEGIIAYKESELRIAKDLIKMREKEIKQLKEEIDNLKYEICKTDMEEEEELIRPIKPPESFEVYRLKGLGQTMEHLGGLLDSSHAQITHYVKQVKQIET